MAIELDGHEEHHHERHPRDRLGRPLPPGAPNELPMPGEPGEIATSLTEALGFAAVLFDAARFYEAHEFFEHLWKSKETREEDRDFWQGVTQLAAAYCHIQRQNRPGAYALFRRAREHLGVYPACYLGVDNRALIRGARRAVAAIKAGEEISFPTFPLLREREVAARALLWLAGAMTMADALWLVIDPRSWSNFWLGFLRKAGRRLSLSRATATGELIFGASLLLAGGRR